MCSLTSLNFFFLLTSWRVSDAYECDAAKKLLMVACLVCDVPSVAKASEGTEQGNSHQVHHSNGGHFRVFHLTTHFPQLRKLFLQEKPRKRRPGGMLGWGQSSPGEQPPPQTPSNCTKLKQISIALELR